jgi:hypothetical protein
MEVFFGIGLWFLLAVIIAFTCTSSKEENLKYLEDDLDAIFKEWRDHKTPLDNKFK